MSGCHKGVIIKGYFTVARMGVGISHLFRGCYMGVDERF